MNKSPLKFLLSLVSACVTLLINGDEDINPNVSAWAFPLMLVCGGLVMLADSKIRPEKYAVAASSKSELVTDFEVYFLFICLLVFSWQFRGLLLRRFGPALLSWCLCVPGD